MSSQPDKIETLLHTKPLDQITGHDIERMVEQKCSENDRLEFKQDRVDAHKLRKIICSFANTSGGFIIFGIREENDRAVGFSDSFESDGFDTWLSEVAGVGFYPRVTNIITYRRIPIQDGIDVAILRVDEHPQRPVCVERSGTMSFPFRSGCSTQFMTFPAIREMILEDPLRRSVDDLHEKLDQLRTQRTALQGPAEVHDSPHTTVSLDTLATELSDKDIARYLIAIAKPEQRAVPQQLQSSRDKIEHTLAKPACGRPHGFGLRDDNETTNLSDGVAVITRHGLEYRVYWDGTVALLFPFVDNLIYWSMDRSSPSGHIPVNVFALVDPISTFIGLAGEIYRQALSQTRFQIELVMCAAGMLFTPYSKSQHGFLGVGMGMPGASAIAPAHKIRIHPIEADVQASPDDSVYRVVKALLKEVDPSLETSHLPMFDDNHEPVFDR